MNDFSETVISIDSNYELDLYAAACKTSVIIRVMSTNRYLLTIEPELNAKLRHKIYRVLLSARGYLLIHTRSEFSGYENDGLHVWSINGEFIGNIEFGEIVNDILLDQYGYNIVL